MLRRIPLAWHNLTSSSGKLALTATGVGFAVVLMFMQIGFRNALLDSNAQLLRMFDADLVVVSQARYNLSSERRLTRSFFASVAAVPGVQKTSAVRMERTQAFVKVEGFKSRSIRVVAIDPDASFFADPKLAAMLVEADRKAAALVDRRSKAAYGFDLRSDDRIGAQNIELNGRTISILTRFNLGTDFANDGTLLMSHRIFPKHFPQRNFGGDPLDTVDLGLVRLDAGADVEQTRQAMQAKGNGEVSIFTLDEFIAREVRFWSRNTPIGIIFGIGTVMGLVVGAIICYQIQFTEITDNMPELATLKAMGYGNSYFLSLVLSQSFYLACLGFFPGLVVSWGLYELLVWASGLVMRLTAERILLVWLLTLVMCLVSGLMVLRKLWRADPATLF